MRVSDDHIWESEAVRTINKCPTMSLFILSAIACDMAPFATVTKAGASVPSENDTVVVDLAFLQFTGTL